MNEEIPIEEINELVEDIKSENKEIYEIMKTKEYKIYYNAFKRALNESTLKIEIVNIDKISLPGEIKSRPTTKTAKKEKVSDLTLENCTNEHETDKAVLLKNAEGKIAWFPKKAVKSIESISKIAVIHGWFTEKIEWKVPKPFEQ